MTKRKEGSTKRTQKPLVINGNTCRAARRNTHRNGKALPFWALGGRFETKERYEPYARSPSKHERNLDLLRVGHDHVHELVVDRFANRGTIPSAGSDATSPDARKGTDKAKEAA